MPMQAWIDDSGLKGQRGYMTLAGLIGEAEEWAAFSEEWKQQLAAPPTISFLSTSDAARLRDEFHNWAAWQRDAKLRRLVATANEFHFTIVHCSVDLNAYEEVFPRIAAMRKGRTVKRLNTLTEQPYFLCFSNICLAACSAVLKHRRTNERFEIIFDEHEIM